MTKTYLEKPADVKRKWFLVDADGKTLGRLAAKVATLLRGKHKPTFTPHVDTGDHVVIVNAEKNSPHGQQNGIQDLFHPQRISGWIENLDRRTYSSETAYGAVDQSH